MEGKGEVSRNNNKKPISKSRKDKRNKWSKSKKERRKERKKGGRKEGKNLERESVLKTMDMNNRKK